MRTLTAVSLALLTTAVSAAGPPSADQIVARMQGMLAPDRPSVREMTFRLSGGDAATHIVVGQVRKTVDGHARVLLVVLAPDGLRGTAYLVQRMAPSEHDVQWIYLPAVGRVRKLVSPEAYTAFLNSDFTYADLGLVPLRARSRLVSESKQDGAPVFVVEGRPAETWYYARMVTSVDSRTGFPRDRKLYDAANQLWKTQRWEQVTDVDGVPTVLHESMEDVQAHSRSDVDVSAVRYDADVPDALVEPTGLPTAVLSPLWAGLG